MQFELTYQMPYRRLAKLRRSITRKVYGTPLLLFGLWLAGWVAAVVAIVLNANALDKWMHGIPYLYRWPLALAPVAALYLASGILGGRFSSRLIKNWLVDYDGAFRLTNDDGGLRFATSGTEYYLKWQGIGWMLMEGDGLVVSNGVLFFLVPDTAFTDAGQRLAFIRDVYGRLGDKARSASDKYIRPVLDGAHPGQRGS